jgi:hypothetical protein
MRSLLWWSREAVVGALVLALVMAIVCPIGAWAIETFSVVSRGKPPPPVETLGPTIVGFVSGAAIGAYIGAKVATHRFLKRRGPAALPDLISTILESKNETVRITAIEVLAELGPVARPAIPALRIALRDESEQVREVVAHALAQIEA